MRFRRLLGVGVAALMFVTVVTGAVAIVALHETTDTQEAVAHRFSNNLRTVERLRFQAEHLVAVSRGYLLTRDDAFERKLVAANDRFQELLQELQEQKLDGVSEAQLRRLDLAATDYVATAKGLTEHQNDILVFFENALSPRRERFMQFLTDFVRQQQQIFDDALHNQEVSSTRAQAAVLLTTLLGLALSFGLAAVVHRKLSGYFASERAASQMARREAAARQEVLAIVSHDLRNPLTTVVMGSALLSEIMPTPPPPGFERHLAAIRNAADRMTNMIDEVLDVAHIESGTIRLHCAAHDAAGVLEGALLLFMTRATARSITLECEPPESPLSVHADRERLLQILSNLIGNALKFTPPGGQVAVSATRDRDSVRFTIRDTGPGIPPHQVPQLFDRYWQGDASERRGSLGLGLFICKMLVESHGGTIGVETSVGVGSRFWFTLPQSPMADCV